LRDGATPLIAGRSCPPHYGYSPRVFARAAEFSEDTLYVVGGLYGNAYALDAIDQMQRHEPVRPRLAFNGDFHWFDVDPDLFLEIQRRVVAEPGQVALRGNVETEIADNDPAVGCGCGYPESVPDDDVERSNAILERLRTVSRSLGARDGPSRQRLGGLPMHAVAQVGSKRIAIVHGDAWSLAGWRFAHNTLHDPAQEPFLSTALEQAAVDGFACSHTCAPALKAFAGRFVINNGAAGMANFDGTTHGVITRISTRALPRPLARLRLYGLALADVFIDALRVEFDFEAWILCFDSLWDAGSPAAVSYRRRIVAGPDFTVAQALGETRAASGRCAVA
jgi:hypothetical protein